MRTGMSPNVAFAWTASQIWYCHVRTSFVAPASNSGMPRIRNARSARRNWIAQMTRGCCPNCPKLTKWTIKYLRNSWIWPNHRKAVAMITTTTIENLFARNGSNLHIQDRRRDESMNNSMLASCYSDSIADLMYTHHTVWNTFCIILNLFIILDNASSKITRNYACKCRFRYSLMCKKIEFSSVSSAPRLHAAQCG